MTIEKFLDFYWTLPEYGWRACLDGADNLPLFWPPAFKVDGVKSCDPITAVWQTQVSNPPNLFMPRSLLDALAALSKRNQVPRHVLAAEGLGLSERDMEVILGAWNNSWCGVQVHSIRESLLGAFYLQESLTV